jgi:hypothetical protein
VDQWLGAYSFRRLDVDLRQYLPFFSKQRVIALRAYTALTDSTTDAAFRSISNPLSAVRIHCVVFGHFVSTITT